MQPEKGLRERSCWWLVERFIVEIEIGGESENLQAENVS